MCGIFFLISDDIDDKVKKDFLKIHHRGPDNSKTEILNYKNKKLFFGFHRLSINGLDEISNQPLINSEIYLICNGEIFNYKHLVKEYKFEEEYKTNSDCEIILHLYKKFGIKETLNKLDGEFAFVLYDSTKEKIFISRDQIGIRSLFIGNKDKDYILSSEVKSINDTYNVKQFNPGTYSEIDLKTMEILEDNRYFKLDQINNNINQEIHIKKIKELFEKAVEKRLLSDRSIGCLLSGGLDSSTVCSIVKNKTDKILNTYSIGLRGSVDLKYAKEMAEYLGTNHYSIELTNDDFLEAIDKTIYQIESYDVTTVRASVGNYLVSLFIKENTEDTVIFCGDVSDEIFGSYKGFYYADNNEKFLDENIKMLNNIQYFDVLRSDKSISGAGLEARVPFGDKDFIKYVMSIDPTHKRFDENRIEKYLFRKAFEDILPKNIAWRSKTAFSDGVGSDSNQWFDVLKKYMDGKYTNEEFIEKSNKYKFNIPYDKESLYYREVFEKYYPNKEKIIPYFWKQPFMNMKDPSAWYVENLKKNHISMKKNLNI